jgi:glycosyltransferase involved in cell wall biosynthesis
MAPHRLGRLPLYALLLALCIGLALHKTLLALRGGGSGRAMPPRASLQHAPAASANGSPLAAVAAGRTFYILTHEMSLSGAPRVCVELAALLHAAGARRVELVVGSGFDGSLPSNGALAERAAAVLGFAAPFVVRGDSSQAPQRPLWRIALAGLLQWDSEASAEVRAAAAADVVIVSSAVPKHVAWLARFRAEAPTHGGLMWWLHEAGSVMGQFPPSHTLASARALRRSSPLLDAAVFPSLSARAWWEATGSALAASDAVMTWWWRWPPPPPPPLPAAAAVVRWGWPAWRAAAKAAGASAQVRGAAREATRAALGLAPQDFVLLALAAFTPLKGHAGMVQALALAQAICGSGSGGSSASPPRTLVLLLAGDNGPLAQPVFPPPRLRWVLDSNSSVRLLAPVVDTAPLLAAADAYVSNSQGGGETWGLSVLDALGAGLPVLSSSAGAAPEMLAHGVTALLHEVGGGGGGEVAGVDGAGVVAAGEAEAGELAGNMCRLAEDNALRARLSDGGLRLVAEQLGQQQLEASVARALAAVLPQ